MATTTWEYGSRLIDKGLSSGTASGSLTLNSNSGFQAKLNEIPANTKITLVKLYATLFSSLSTNDYTVKLNGTTIASGSNVLTSATPTKLDIDITKYAETETTNAGNINGDLYVSIGPGLGTKVCEDIKIIWTYNLPNHTITAIPNNSSYGTVTGGGTYEERKVITLTATPKTGYQFSHWQDDSGNTSATRQVTVGTSDATYTAIFVQKNITFKVTSNDYGKVELYYTPYNSSIQQGPFTGRNLSYDLQEGSTIKLTAIPNPGCYLVAWGDGSTSASKSLTLTSNIAAQSVNFKAYIDGSGSVQTSFYKLGDTYGSSTIYQSATNFINKTENLILPNSSSLEKCFFYDLNIENLIDKNLNTKLINLSNIEIKKITYITTYKSYDENSAQYTTYKIAPIGTWSNLGDITSTNRLHGDSFSYIQSDGTTVQSTGVSDEYNGDFKTIVNNSSISSETTSSVNFNSDSGTVKWINENLTEFLNPNTTFGFLLHCKTINISSIIIQIDYDYTNNYTISAKADPSVGGTVSGAGTYHKGLEVNLIADAVDNQYEFSHWNEETPPSKLTDKGYKAVYATSSYAATTYIAHFVPKFINEIYVKEKLSDSLWLGDSEITSIWIGPDTIVYGYK